MDKVTAVLAQQKLKEVSSKFGEFSNSNEDSARTCALLADMEAKREKDKANREKQYRRQSAEREQIRNKLRAKYQLDEKDGKSKQKQMEHQGRLQSSKGIATNSQALVDRNRNFCTLM